MKDLERKYGYIVIPETGEKIENVWLIINSKEIYLEAPFTIFGNQNWPIVHGVFNGMDKITLIDVFSSGGSSGSGGSFRKFIVTWLLKNEHFNSISEVKFKSIAFREKALMTWYREQFSIKSKELTYTVPDPIYPLIKELQSFKMTWQLAHEVKQERREVSMRQTSSVVSEFNEEISWNQIVDHILKVKKLIIFLTNKDPQLSRYYLNGDIELIFNPPKLNDLRFPSHIELDYFDTKEHLPEIIKMWFEQPKLEPITDLILEKHFNVDISPHRHFFNLAVGLEAFHKEFIIKNVSLHDNQAEINRDIIKELIEDGNLRDWFRNMSSDWKKPTLKDRLFNMQETIEKVSLGVFDLTTEELITKIKQTRDDIAHAGIFYKRFESRIELMIVAKIIEFTLRIEIYKKFGLTVKNANTDMYKEANTLCKKLAALNEFTLAENK